MPGTIALYREDGSTQPYELTELSFELKDNGVAVVAFATPQNLNGLSPQKRMETFCMLEHIRRDPKIKAVVWTGEGRAFSSGVSLKGSTDILVPDDVVEEYARRKMAPNMRNDSAFVRETLAFWDTHKPLIAAVNGMAVGGGANMALCNYFDIVYCSTEAKFKWPFVDIGFTPELGSSLVLPYMAGTIRAKEIMFTGDWFSAEQIKSFGLVNEVVQPADLMPTALAMADKLASKMPPQLKLSKMLLNANLRSQLENALRLENETIQASVLDFGGAKAFMGRRNEHKKSPPKNSKL